MDAPEHENGSLSIQTNKTENLKIKTVRWLYYLSNKILAYVEKSYIRAENFQY